LVGRGVRGIISIGKAFRIMDDNNSRTLDFNEFRKASKDYRWDLSDREVEIAFRAFNEGGEGEIDYEEFLRTIRGNMNQFRVRLCEQAFRKIDRDGSGILTIDDLRGVYNAKKHPEVIAGRKTEDEVFIEYLDTFEAHHSLLNGNDANHEIDLEEWIEYYQNVSMSIDDDKYFEVMMNNCWRMNEHTTGNNEKRGWSNKDESPNKQQNISNAYNQRAGNSGRVGSAKGRQEQERPQAGRQEQERPQTATNSAIEKFRSKLLSRGARGIIGISRQFKIFDDDNSKTIDFEEFKKAVKDFRVDLTPNEIKVVFGTFDRDGQGSIDYDEFLRQIRGEMNERRKKIALQAFDKMDKDGNGVLEINDIKYVYNAKNHPEVRAGKKSEEEVFGEFLETFETHHNILKGNRDRRVTKDEWIEYYNNVSMSIDDDGYFETMMVNAWKLNGNVNYAKGWAGDYSDKKQVAEQKKVFQNAPFGVSEEKTNYSTSNKQVQANQKNNFSNKGEEVLIRFREKISARGTRGIFGIRRSFMIADDNHSKTIDYNEFAKLVKDYRYELSPSDVKKLFDIFDSNRSGDIDYEEFLRSIVGEMNDFRKGLAKKAFAKMDKNNNGSLEIDDIKGTYNAKKCPDVISGKKTEDEVLAEFLDTFEYHFSLLVIIFFKC
jgi:Ca2+-binding EF-hand superfamily protein